MIAQKTVKLPMSLRWLCALVAAMAVGSALLPSGAAEPSRRALRTTPSDLTESGTAAGGLMHAAANLLGSAQPSLGLLQQTSGVPMARLNPERPCQGSIFVDIIVCHDHRDRA